MGFPVIGSLERYMASDDPEFEEKAADVLTLYMEPPQHAAFLCVVKRPRFRRWTGWTRSFRFRRAERKNMGSNTAATKRIRSCGSVAVGEVTAANHGTTAQSPPVGLD